MNFYSQLQANQHYHNELEQVIFRTYHKLASEATSSNRPGMLLGNIQSGKTRAFIGVMGVAFDRDYDIAIVLTKSSNALLKQTCQRLMSEFHDSIENDQARVYDIMKLPNRIRKYERNQKLMLVVKKETKNLDRLHELFFETHPELKDKRILFIDDEADYASVSYHHNQASNITELRVISSKLDQLRKGLSYSSYLQVTATPYSLYLQPEDRTVHEQKSYLPIRPAFTEIVPIHDQYIGSKTYFDSELSNTLFWPVNEQEIEVLKKQDRRRVKETTLLTTGNVKGLRHAFINFVTAAAVRWEQQRHANERWKKYSFLIHTDRGKKAHEWQADVVIKMEEQFRQLMHGDELAFQKIVEESYEHVIQSTTRFQPTFEHVYECVKKALNDEHVVTEVVNSEQDVENLLNQQGELRLHAPLNIFIGGQILDRGITVQNVIGFYYGRNPRNFQQDTVMQHSRMYGARAIDDVVVTRFYTTQKIYNVMKRMHEFDSELRRSLSKEGEDQKVVFIEKAENEELIPCSPNKLLLSELQTLAPHKRILPTGFQTDYRTRIIPHIKRIDRLLLPFEDKQVGKLSLSAVSNIFDLISETLVMDEGYSFHVDDVKAMIAYAAKKDFAHIVVKTNRNIRRLTKTGVYETSPDTASTKSSELRVARQLAKTTPAIIFLRQNGKEEHGWSGTPFWWPIIVLPSTMTSTIYANKTIQTR
ncbi:Z1 domain-containing protein [Geomicrobium sediminis]|uniref:Putative endonuclease Z1 domain-containing protein n=1 Tax=Geomicrobium sediminis TaxID=1347788 RepID=A0ABS2PAT4_9BACL|nr:Z1 domain-containing protein [Geomicrobium sediminis]MBM7632432.1 hypothetical protein [Geomicrobium sediminis]